MDTNVLFDLSKYDLNVVDNYIPDGGHLPFNGVYTYQYLFDSSLFLWNSVLDKNKLKNRRKHSDNKYPQSMVNAELLKCIDKITPNSRRHLVKPIKLIYDYCRFERDFYNDSDKFDGTKPRCRFCGTYQNLVKCGSSYCCKEHLSYKKCAVCGLYYPISFFGSSNRRGYKCVHIGCATGEFTNYPTREADLLSDSDCLCLRCNTIKKKKDMKIGSSTLCKDCHSIEELYRRKWHESLKDKNASPIYYKLCTVCRKNLLLENFEHNNYTYDNLDKICKECKHKKMGYDAMYKKSLHNSIYNKLRGFGLTDEIIAEVNRVTTNGPIDKNLLNSK